MVSDPPIKTPEKLFSGFRIATMSNESETPYGLLENHSIGVSSGMIDWVLPDSKIPDSPEPEVIRGKGNLLSPGLIDCHTHIVYGGNRADEWARRLAGETYESIASQGGGILSTVRATRSADEEQLFESSKLRLKCLMQEGVTTVEIKSGYGLDLATELKMLRVAEELGRQLPIDVEPTLLAAHACPPEFRGRQAEFIDMVCNEIIPAAASHCTAVDVFCEKIAFDLDQSHQVLKTAKDFGLKTKIHAEQLSHMGAAAMAAQLGAVSADHLEYLTESDCELLGDCGTVATLLPGAYYCLQETQMPPVQALFENQVPIAIATDSNPGSSPLLSLQLAANMACILFGIVPEQAFAGMTRNAAGALGLLDSRGTIEAGKKADFAIWNVDSPAEILYTIGRNSCIGVFKDGEQDHDERKTIPL